MLVMCIHALEIEILRIPKSVMVKRRKISKKREILRKELAHHIKQMRGEGKRIKDYTNQHIQYEFYKVMCSWRRVQRFIDDVFNLKFDAHLRNFG